MTKPIKVKFVIFKNELLALLPDIKENNDCIQCYAHIGQHSAASKNLMKCKKANEKEFLPLLMELKQVGYDNLFILNDMPKKNKKVKINSTLAPTVIQVAENNEVNLLKGEIEELNDELLKTQNKLEELENDFEEYKESDNDELNEAANMNEHRGNFLESLKMQATNLKYKYYFKDIPDDIKTILTLISDIEVNDETELVNDSKVIDFKPLLPL